MKRNALSIRTLFVASWVVVLTATWMSSALALDSYQDRRGFFSGVGFGGGFVGQDGNGGGDLVVDFQFGGGANRLLTIALDVDLTWHVMAAYHNFVITPGPEVTYYLGATGFYLKGGVAPALVFMNYNEPRLGLDDRTFELGVNGSAGIGWEFFVGASYAIGLGLDGDYIFTRMYGEVTHITAIACSFTLRYF